MGKITPVSLFAAITEQSEAPGNARRRASRSSAPDAKTGTRTHSGTCAQAPPTAGCSTAVVTTFRGREPRIASASASVPPEVKITSRGAQPSACAQRSRAVSTSARASCPGLWTDDGFAKKSASAGVISASTSRESGVVAFASR
jgi:hypothetical protein